ncbi:MAG: hypothetical protein ABI670_13585 [Chloroflexota bacterium]
MGLLPARMPTQTAPEVEVQCPRCGARRALRHFGRLDPVTGQFFRPNFGLSRATTVAIVLGCGTVALWVSTALFGQDATIPGLVVGLLVALAIISVFAYQAAVAEARSIRIHHYECLYCHYRWDWKEGSSIPRFREDQQIRQDFEEVFGHAPEDSET